MLMGMDINLTPNIVKLLQVFLQDPDASRFGTELTREASVSPGSLYPALRRLEKANVIVGTLEDIDPSVEGRPARRYYRLTVEGARDAHLALTELSARVAPPTARGWLPSPSPSPRGV
jgi:PadR family transcriptional regulator PadR